MPHDRRGRIVTSAGGAKLPVPEARRVHQGRIEAAHEDMEHGVGVAAAARRNVEAGVRGELAGCGGACACVLVCW